MKQHIKKFILYLMTVVYLFMSCPFYVYASEHGGGGGSDHNSDFITDSGTINIKDDGVVMYYIEYILANIGAVLFDHDITKVMSNDQTMKEYISKGKYDASKKTVTFPKETVIYVKQQFDQYAKEYEPYDICSTFGLSTLDYNCLNNQKNVYDTLKNLIDESKNGYIRAMFYRKTSTLYISIFDDIKDIGFVKRIGFSNYGAQSYYISTWKQASVPVYGLVFSHDDPAVSSFDEYKNKATVFIDSSTHDYTYMNYFSTTKTNTWVETSFSTVMPSILSTKPTRFRVYNTFEDFQDYTLGKRSVYYTSKYYEYVPEDLTVSIDDLQKTVDDLQKVIDELVKRITDRTDESEIEELLRQILEALKNQQGTGSGSGGGDVNVNVDLTTTNNWLSKIYTKAGELSDKLSKIYEKISSPPALTMDGVIKSIEDLGYKLERYLKKISGDLDDIKDQLADMTEEEFEERSDSFLNETMDSFSEISGVAQTKFPFSIISDMRLLISKMAPPSSEPEAALYSVNPAGISLYSEDHGGGGASRGDDEDDDSGGGGASRPASDNFISVEHGGGGGSRGSAEMKNGAPVFCLPIVIERYGIEEYIVVNMAPFEPVSKLSRSLFAIMFMLCLVNLTFKTMGLWGDLVG